MDRFASKRLMFNDAIDRYLREVTPTKKPTTQRVEKLRAESLKVYFGKYSLAAINEDIVAEFRDHRLTEKWQRNPRKRGAETKDQKWIEGKSANTVRLDLALLGHLFTVAIREWRLGLVRNPVSNIRKPSPCNGRDRRLTPDEEKNLRAAVGAHSNPMLRWIFEIAIETGMRSSEITSLRLSQVDAKRRLVRLRNTKNEDARTVPLSILAASNFAAAIANPTRPEGCDLVFFGEPGKDGVRRPYNFNKVWLNIEAKLGIADFRFHDLRHEAVSRFVEAGLSDQEVAAISGHKSMQMLRRYTHLRAEDLVKKLDSAKEAKTSNARSRKKSDKRRSKE